MKSPKLYFYDTGLACSLLEIESEKQLTTHYLRGGLFESYIMSELVKLQCNKGRRPTLYFWRDKSGHEIDCIIEKGADLLRIEIKSTKTVTGSLFDNLKYWSKLAEVDDKKSFLVYTGEKSYKRGNVNVVSWQSLEKILL